MEIIKYPSRNEWRKIIERPHLDTLALHEKVSNILNDIRENGDSRIRSYVEQFQGVRLSDLEVSEKEFTKAETLIDPKLKDAILTAKENIAKFHSSSSYNASKDRDLSGSNVLAKSGRYRTGRAIYTRRNGTAIFYGINACSTSTYCRMP